MKVLVMKIWFHGLIYFYPKKIMNIWLQKI